MDDRVKSERASPRPLYGFRKLYGSRRCTHRHPFPEHRGQFPDCLAAMTGDTSETCWANHQEGHMSGQPPCGVCYFWTWVHTSKLLSYIFLEPLLPPHQAMCFTSEFREDDEQSSRILLEPRQKSYFFKSVPLQLHKVVGTRVVPNRSLFLSGSSGLLCSCLQLRFRASIIRIGKGIRPHLDNASRFRVGAMRALRSDLLEDVQSQQLVRDGAQSSFYSALSPLCRTG